MPPARGRAACNICRTRKQKCDGIRPSCSRCRTFGSQCTWPTILKRGPPKGYTKALEIRLRETEMVLIRLLRSTNDHELIARAFNDNNQELRFNERITEHSIGEQRILALLNHWERFPLRTADDVVQWIEEAGRSSIVQGGAGSGEASRPVERSHDITHQPEADIESHVGSEDDLSVESRHGDAVDQGSLSLPPMEISSVETAQAPIPADKVHEVRNTTASSMIELPADFKDQFLW